MSKLPEARQQAINSFDWLNKCQEIGEKHKLLEEEIAGLKTEVALVLIGLSDLDTLHKHIDLEIGGTGWEEIEKEVTENILSPIHQLWMKSWELFLTRDAKDQQLIELCKAILDEWSDRIPFSPIKKLGSKTEFVSAVEHATYKTEVGTQIEKRWLEEHEVPYYDEELPPSPLPKSSIDPWKISFNPFADFKKHHRTQEMLETRRAYDCSTCKATGEVTCGDCSGSGQVNCRECDGYGYNKCSSCRGRGQIQETRRNSKQVNCFSCGGKGTDFFSKTCTSCNGRGTKIEEYAEEYFVPCGNCASSGKITCSNCRGNGKVTCGRCGGGGKVTCDRCEGQRRLLSYTTVEVEEDVSVNENQYISASLPKFKKKDNPLSKLDGPTVFTQDETKRIDQFEFQRQPAAAVLSNEVELCRASHTGHILRQHIEIETCVLVEYRYRHSTKEYSIYINPQHNLVEDLEGPVQSFIQNTDALAEKAFKEKRSEDAYRLITRGLCMDETTEAEKKLRDQILRALLVSYHKIGLVSWFGAAIIWCLVGGLSSNFHISWWFVLGLIPLLLGIQMFAEDFGVRFSGPKDRMIPAVSIGIAAFFSGVVIGSGTSWTDWIGLASLTAGAGAFGLFRSKARAKLKKLEAFFPTFPNPQALEAYVLTLDPKHELSSRIKLVLVALVALLAVQPTVKLASGINQWALDRTKIQFNVQIDGKTTEAIPEIQFNGKPIHSGDKVQPGKGVIEVTDIQFMPFRREMQVSYGRAAKYGTIPLEPSKGSVVVNVNPSPAKVILNRNGEKIREGNAPLSLDKLLVGNYELLVQRGEYEERHSMNL